MTETFFSLLEKRVQDSSSLICVGFDPRSSDLPNISSASYLDFCLNLIHQTAPYTAAFKLNPAYFETFRSEGWDMLRQVIDAVQKESIQLASMIPVILDSRYNDLGSTANAYAEAAFDGLGAHCITLNPYLGKDSIEPFIRDQRKGAFLLCKTSNAGSMDIQNLLILPVGSDSPMPLYNYVAQLAQQWNENNNVGIVVGAAHPQIMSNIRASAPDLWFLSSGVNPEGAELVSALKAGLRSDGSGMLIEMSPGNARTSQSPAEAVKNLRDKILKITDI